MPQAASAPSLRAADPPADAARRHNEGHGRRLTAAFEATMVKKTTRDRERHANNPKLRQSTDYTDFTDF